MLMNGYGPTYSIDDKVNHMRAENSKTSFEIGDVVVIRSHRLRTHLANKLAFVTNVTAQDSTLGVRGVAVSIIGEQHGSVYMLNQQVEMVVPCSDALRAMIQAYAT